MNIVCPHCLSPFDRSGVTAGMRVDCPTCGKEFTVKFASKKDSTVRFDAQTKLRKQSTSTKFNYTSDSLSQGFVRTVVLSIMSGIFYALIFPNEEIGVFFAILTIVSGLVLSILVIRFWFLLCKKIDNIESSNSAMLNELKKIAAKE